MGNQSQTYDGSSSGKIGLFLSADNINTSPILTIPTQKPRRLWNTGKVILFLIYCGFLFGIGDLRVGLQTNDLLYSKAIRATTVGLSLIICLSSLARRNALGHIRCRTVFPIVCYWIVCSLSTFVAAMPLLTFFKSLEMLLIVLFCCISIDNEQLTASGLYKFIIMLITISIIIVLAEAIVFPGRAFVKMNQSGPLLGYMLFGVFPPINANAVGFLSGMVAIAVLPFAFAGQHKKSILFLLFIGITVTFLSYSRMAILAFFVAAVIIFWMLRKYNKLMLLLGLALCLTLGILLMQGNIRSSVAGHLSRGKDVGSVDEFSSGRLSLWNYVIKENRNILIGEGFATALRHKQYLGYSINAHSSIIEVYSGIGLIGVAIWIWMVSRILISLYRMHLFGLDSDRIIHVSVCGVMVYILVKSLASNMLVDLNYGFVIVACIVVYIEKKWKSIQWPQGIVEGCGCYEQKWAFPSF